MKVVIALLLIFSLTFVCWSQITINFNELHQNISGFGVSSAWIASDMDNSIADLFFSVDKGVGLSLLRTRIAPDGTTEIGTAQKAQARGATVWSTPWSPPAKWKSNNNLNNGGYLLPQHYQDYATYLADYFAYAKSHGVNLYAISMQNEPNWSPDYESCTFSSQQFHDFIAVVGPTFERRGVTAKIVFPEEIGFQWDLAQATFNDPNVLKYVGILGFHLYYLTPGTLNNHGKLVWETEVSDSSAEDVTMTSALKYAQLLHESMTISNANAFHYWWVWSLGNDNAGLLTQTKQPTKRLYMMGNWAKFVRPGFLRVGTTGTINGVQVSAYRITNSSPFVIVIVNHNNNAITIDFTMSGGPPVAGVFPYVTNDQYNLQAMSFVSVTGSTFRYTVTPRSITSLVNK